MTHDDMDKVEKRKWFVENLSTLKCPMCDKPTIIKGQYCCAECGTKAAQKAYETDAQPEQASGDTP